MKRFLLLLCLTTLMYNVQAQQTYYWVGGATTSSIKTNANWNTALNGSGSVRTVNGIDDVLIFDGSNIGGATPTTGAITVSVSSDSSSKFIFQNNVNVTFIRPVGGGGSGTLTLMGGTGGDDLIIGQGSSVTINSSATDGNVYINLLNGATGSIDGNLTITGTGANRLTSQTLYGLVFKSTAVCTVSTTPAASGYPFGSATQGLNNGIVFQSGSQLITSGTYSPMGGSSTHQAALMLPGSNYYIRATNGASTGTWLSTKYFGNVYIQNAATVTADGSVLSMGSLTIDAGCTYITHTSGSTPILGNLVVNGTLSAPAGSTNTIVFGGNAPQTLSGTGTITIPSLVVSDVSDVTMSNNINVSNSTQITGKLNFGTSVISGTGTFSSRTNPSAPSMTGTVMADSLRINNLSIGGTLTAPSGLTGLTVSGKGIQPNTTVVATSGGGFYLILSKPATASTAIDTLTFSGGTSTLTTSNPNGFDSTTGCVTLVGKKSFQAGTNYFINAATAYPIGITSGQTASMTVGNITLNAPVTTNINTKVNGVLTMNSGVLTVRPTDTVIIAKTASIAGAPFSNAKYIALTSSGANMAALRADSFATAKALPVGDATHYLPVGLSTTDSSTFLVSAFKGATVDGTITGAALTGAQKANAVDAIWNITRSAGANPCIVALGWPAALEGANFSTLANNQIGVGDYTAGIWNLNTGTGDNTANTATATFTTFGPLCVGRIGDNLLPVKLLDINAATKNNSVKISWEVATEINMNKYVIERSADGKTFVTVGQVFAINATNYSFMNNDLSAGTYYFRVLSVDKTGKTVYSNILKVALQTKLTLNVYPNPATNEVMVSGLAAGSTIQLVDLTGKVYSQKTTTGQVALLNVQSLAKGMYIIKVINTTENDNTISFIKK